jgi:hypothetical protein
MAGSKTFYEYFKESMDSMGLPAPASLFGTLTTATASVNAIVGAVAKVGTTATLSELLTSVGVLKTGAAAAAKVGAAGELAAAVAGVTAAFYAGACLGALLYATQMSLGLDPFASNAPADIGRALSRATSLGISVPNSMNTAIAHAVRSNAVRGTAPAATA